MLFILLFVLAIIKVSAQYSVRFIVKVPENTRQLYIGGSFNNWRPADKIYQFTAQSNQTYTCVIQNLEKKSYRYKFSQGDWSISDSDSIGIDIENRVLDIKNDTTVYCTISAWSNDYYGLRNLPDSTLYHATMSRTRY